MRHSYPLDLVFISYFLKIMVEINASGLSHVSKLLLGLSKSLLIVRCCDPTNLSFLAAEFEGDIKTAPKLR